MVRTDDDTWDINESVGATALGVAAGRAAEHIKDKPLVADPYAQLFLEAAGDGIWSLYLSDDLPVQLAEVDPRFRERLDAMRDYIACRTLFFDEFFCRCRCRRSTPVRDLGRRSGRLGVAISMAGWLRGLRN